MSIPGKVPGGEGGMHQTLQKHVNKLKSKPIAYNNNQ